MNEGVQRLARRADMLLKNDAGESNTTMGRIGFVISKPCCPGDASPGVVRGWYSWNGFGRGHVHRVMAVTGDQ